MTSCAAWGRNTCNIVYMCYEAVTMAVQRRKKAWRKKKKEKIVSISIWNIRKYLCLSEYNIYLKNICLELFERREIWTHISEEERRKKEEKGKIWREICLYERKKKRRRKWKKIGICNYSVKEERREVQAGALRRRGSVASLCVWKRRERKFWRREEGSHVCTLSQRKAVKKYHMRGNEEDEIYNSDPSYVLSVYENIERREEERKEGEKYTPLCTHYYERRKDSSGEEREEKHTWCCCHGYCLSIIWEESYRKVKLFICSAEKKSCIGRGDCLYSTNAEEVVWRKREKACRLVVLNIQRRGSLHIGRGRLQLLACHWCDMPVSTP